MIVKAELRRITNLGPFAVALSIGVMLVAAGTCQAQIDGQERVSIAAGANSQPPNGADRNESAASGTPANPETHTSARNAEMSSALAKVLADMQAEIEELKTELKRNPGPSPATPKASAAAAAVNVEAKSASPAASTVSDESGQARSGLPEKPKPAEPFAYADWTWLNGNPRNKDVVWDSKFFTPEIRMDIHYT
jgi:hypothetical protein